MKIKLFTLAVAIFTVFTMSACGFGDIFETHEIGLNDSEAEKKEIGLFFQLRSDGTYAVGASKDANSLESIVIPEMHEGKKVTRIFSGGFKGLTNLKSITIPDSITGIEQRAFEGCTGLKSISIPDSVTYMGMYTFKDCKGITVYCEASRKPSGWADWWNSSGGSVVWGS